MWLYSKRIRDTVFKARLGVYWGRGQYWQGVIIFICPRGLYTSNNLGQKILRLSFLPDKVPSQAPMEENTERVWGKIRASIPHKHTDRSLTDHLLLQKKGKQMIHLIDFCLLQWWTHVRPCLLSLGGLGREMRGGLHCFKEINYNGMWCTPRIQEEKAILQREH